jgi:hypothetical protein
MHSLAAEGPILGHSTLSSGSYREDVWSWTECLTSPANGFFPLLHPLLGHCTQSRDVNLYRDFGGMDTTWDVGDEANFLQEKEGQGKPSSSTNSKTVRKFFALLT